MARRFPEWIRRPWGTGTAFVATRDLLDDLEVSTVCQSARCPNMGECWAHRVATFMILGEVCTRDCRFCAVGHGVPAPPDSGEPARVAEAVRRLGLRHAVVTSVTRDDLPDGGAAQFRATIEAIRAAVPDATVEVLTPDFHGDPEAIGWVLDASPEVFGHNIETVERLYPSLRGSANSYARGLDVLRTAALWASDAIVKSALMVGHGETHDEVTATLEDLLEAGCTAVCIGQYLQPTARQSEVAAFVTPDQFAAYEAEAYRLGFAFASAGPFVRSSYRSEELFEALRRRRLPDADRNARATFPDTDGDAAFWAATPGGHHGCIMR